MRDDPSFGNISTKYPCYRLQNTKAMLDLMHKWLGETHCERQRPHRERERERERALSIFNCKSDIRSKVVILGPTQVVARPKPSPTKEASFPPPMCPQLRVGSRLLRSTVFYCGTKSSGMNTGESLSTSSPTWKCKKEVSVLLFCLRRRFNYNLELSIPGVSAERA